MTITYDSEVDALYIRFLPQSTVLSEEVAPGIVIDRNETGQLYGIEILDASKRIGDMQALLQATLVTHVQPVKA